MKNGIVSVACNRMDLIISPMSIGVKNVRLWTGS